MVCDTVLVAGEGKDSIPISGVSKVFFPLEQVPLFLWVVKTLLKAERIGTIVIIGNAAELIKAAEEQIPSCLREGKVIIVEQKSSIFENAWEGFLNTLPEYRNKSMSMDELLLKYADKPTLFLPSDAPLIVSEEIDSFIENSDTGMYDACIGLTPEEVILPFAPRDDIPGIKMACLHLKEGLFRINNLFLVNPVRFKSGSEINEMYRYRYQKKVSSMLGLLVQLSIRPNFLNLLRHFVLLQSGTFLTNITMKRTSDFVRMFCAPMEKIVADLSVVAKLKLCVVKSQFPGSALDIDNERDLKTMETMFGRWRKKIAYKIEH